MSCLPEAAADVTLVQAPCEPRGVLRNLPQRRTQCQQVVAMHHMWPTHCQRHPRAQGLIAEHIQRVGWISTHRRTHLAWKQQVLVDITRPFGEPAWAHPLAHLGLWAADVHRVTTLTKRGGQHACVMRLARQPEEGRVGVQNQMHRQPHWNPRGLAGKQRSRLTNKALQYRFGSSK